MCNQHVISVKFMCNYYMHISMVTVVVAMVTMHKQQEYNPANGNNKVSNRTTVYLHHNSALEDKHNYNAIKTIIELTTSIR